MIKKFIINFLLLYNVCCCFSQYNVKAANFNINFTPSTESICFINLDTDTQVYTKNADEKMYPASTTKIMTYIIAVEKVLDLENTKTTVKQETLKKLDGTGSSIAGLKAGEELSIKQLLYCMMIPSGNDAALVIADFVGDGDDQVFIDLMNEKAVELGCTGTHFMNPHGLYDPDHYVTANDLAKITKFALTLPDFLSICSETVSYARGEDKPPLVTTNSMIYKRAKEGYYYYEYAKGIKTGHLDESGNCIVSTAIRDGYNYLCVALGAKDMDKNYAMLDSRQLYRWAFSELDIKNAITSEDVVSEIKVNFGQNSDTLLLTPQTNVSAILPKSVNKSSIEIVVEKPEYIDAPIQKNQKIGTAVLSYANQEIARVDLVASQDVNKSFFLEFFNVFCNIISSKIFVISVITILIMIVLYIILVFCYRKKKFQHKKRR